MSQSLAVKYRPVDWSDVVEQSSIIKILQRQLSINQIKNCYLFCGSSGCGKTTVARIFASKINEGVGQPIEIDGASNSGVDNVRNIIKGAQERSLEGKYKIYIIDECHALSSAAWQSFLKCIEEPPLYTIFIFCTTDAQKIPATILNRVQRYNFNRITINGIKERLIRICKQEQLKNYDEAVDYIAKISDGCLREAITSLDKCTGYSEDLSIGNVLNALGNYSYDVFFTLINAMIDGNEKLVLSIIAEYYNKGSDLKLLVDQYLVFCLDIAKYALFKSCDVIRIPVSMENELLNAINFENPEKYYSYIVDKLLELKNMIKNDTNIRSSIEVMFLRITRCQ